MKLLLIAFASVSGYFILREIPGPEWLAYTGFVSGFLIAVAALKFEKRVNRAPLRIVFGGAGGLIVGLIVANLLTYPLVLKFFNNPYLEFTAYIFTNCVLGYLGLSIGMKKGDELRGRFPFDSDIEQKANPSMSSPASLLLDTSLIVPQFVLGELQYIADSSDPLKKARGARGLDILERLQKKSPVDVILSQEDFPATKQVDMKLVEFAKKYNAKILTNDVNLNKIAKLHGVTVLNINNLANALKPVILPNEELKILVVKEGKENGQGVGYLDDGTMVVIDSGIHHVGKTIDVSVTSILQTSNGRLIFSKVKDAGKSPSMVRAVPS